MNFNNVIAGAKKRYIEGAKIEDFYRDRGTVPNWEEIIVNTRDKTISFYQNKSHIYIYHPDRIPNWATVLEESPLTERSIWENRIWTTRDGKHIKIKNMDTNHITNALAMMKRDGSTSEGITFLTKELEYRKIRKAQRERAKNSKPDFEIFF